jgi:hypothetical protein
MEAHAARRCGAVQLHGNRTRSRTCGARHTKGALHRAKGVPQPGGALSRAVGPGRLTASARAWKVGVVRPGLRDRFRRCSMSALLAAPHSATPPTSVSEQPSRSSSVRATHSLAAASSPSPPGLRPSTSDSDTAPVSPMWLLDRSSVRSEHSRPGGGGGSRHAAQAGRGGGHAWRGACRTVWSCVARPLQDPTGSLRGAPRT